MIQVRNDGRIPCNRPTREENESDDDELDQKRSRLTIRGSMSRGGGDEDRGVSNSREEEGEEHAFAG